MKFWKGLHLDIYKNKKSLNKDIFVYLCFFFEIIKKCLFFGLMNGYKLIFSALSDAKILVKLEFKKIYVIKGICKKKISSYIIPM